MPEKVLLICLVVVAIMAVSTANFRRAVIYLAIFSLIMSLTFLFYKAPDVAIAEAVIGSALSTVLFLVALRKQDRLTICVQQGNSSQAEVADALPGVVTSLLQAVRVHFRNKRISIMVVHSSDSIESLLKTQQYDLLLIQAEDQVTLYGRPADYRLDEIENLLPSLEANRAKVQIVRYEEGGASVA